MSFVSITRLRIRSWRFMPAFVLATRAADRQVRAAPGYLHGGLLADRRLTFWTKTLWTDAAAMRAYMVGGAHRRAMPKLLHWCDEASIAHWDAAVLPDWTEAAARMREEGRPSKLLHPSAAHAALTFAAPRTTGSAPLPRVA